MLTRFRIEVEGADSAAAAEEELSKYEHAIQVAEAGRYGIWYERDSDYPDQTEDRAFLAKSAPAGASTDLAIVVHKLLSDDGYPVTHPWEHAPVERDYFNDQLGREVTDEVIEFDPSLPGYRGRRVVQFKRADTRM